LVQKVILILKGSLEVKLGNTKCISALKQCYTTSGRGKHVSEIEKELNRLTAEGDKDNFYISFMLFALSWYLASNTIISVCHEFLNILKNVSKIKKFNWCTLLPNI
jgi:hypothetical protein